eukprot:scpid38427/ scgid2041/ ELMO domain-containing protein 3; RNA-binding motif and ELMO domain-containing protein 1; RNA-binding motif protein 29; RNA-binding protein 29
MEENGGKASGVKPSVFDDEAAAAYEALMSDRKSPDSSIDSFGSPSSPTPVDQEAVASPETTVLVRVEHSPESGQHAIVDADLTAAAASQGSESSLNFRPTATDVADATEADGGEETDGVAGMARLSPYAVKKKSRMVIVYSSASVTQQRSDLVSGLLGELPDVFSSPQAVCTALHNATYYSGGHPCTNITSEVFRERQQSGDFFVTYQMQMRQPQGAPVSVATSPSASSVGSAHGSGSGSPAVTSPTQDGGEQPRRRRQLPSVPPAGTPTSPGAPASPCSNGSASTKTPPPVQVGISKDSVDGVRSRGLCMLLSLETAGALTASKSRGDAYDIGFVYLAKDEESSEPFSPEHPVIVMRDGDDSALQFRNVVLVSAGQVHTNSKTLSPSTASRVELQARTEWETVATVPLSMGANADSSFAESRPQSVVSIAFAEALAYFQSRHQTLQQKHGVFQQLKKPGLFATKLRPSLVCERDLVYVIANTPFDNSEPTHFRILLTIYKKLTGDVIDCPRFGSHWQSIGFQGTDPATDLRAAGLLSLVHMLHLLTNSELLPLAMKVYRLSNHEVQNFPFAVLSINLTLMALQSLEQGPISRLCNKRQQVISTLNDIYAACMFRLYNTWKSGRKTIVDSEQVLGELRLQLANHPRQLLSDLEKHQEKMREEFSQRRTSTQL